MDLKIKKFILLLGDIIVLHLSLLFTLAIRYGWLNLENNWINHYPSFLIIFIIWILIFYIYNLYNLLASTDKIKFNNLALNAILISSLLSTAFFYLNIDINIAPKTNLVIFIILTTILFITWRKFFNYSLKSYLPKSNLLIISKKNKVTNLLNFLQKKPQLGFKTVLVVEDLLDKEDLKTIIIEKNIHTVVLDSRLEQVNEWRKLLFSCLENKLIFTDLSSFYEKITGKVDIETITHTWFLENFNEGNKKYFNHIKRLFDLSLSIILLIISIPFWIIIPLIILFDSGKPVIYKQKRLGKGGKEFVIIKFRTMKNEEITRSGKFLRKTRLDEIPQLLNIFKNDMSFIGPRPERTHIAKDLNEKIPFYHERLLIKPGLSGWDQISDNYHTSSYLDSFEKLQYDLFYIKNRSIYLDISIILKTVSTVLRRRGR